MAISSNVPQLVRHAVDWLKVEEICEYLPDLPAFGSRKLWPYRQMNVYTNQWWAKPGDEVTICLTPFAEDYLRDLAKYKEEVCVFFQLNC